MADSTSWLPLALVLTALVPAAVIFMLPERREGTRQAVNMTGAVLKLGLVLVLLIGVAGGSDYEWRRALLPGIDLVLRVDPIPLLFVTLSSLLWLATTVYAIGYLEPGQRRSRFFGFFSLCVTATIGIALAGNLVTFLLFYELLTIATYPLVAHEGTGRALRGARVYLAYSLGGGAVLLVGVVLLHVIAGPVEFLGSAPLVGVAATHPGLLTLVFVMLVGGMAVKTALVPLHGWLPRAMVAPAPVSAMLHAVAVVKAGAYGIVRVVHDLYGVELVQDLGLLTPLAVIAAVTIVYGSLRALTQDDLKRRLAFSTVSQIAYVVLGITLVSVAGLTGGLVHLVHQGLQKATLFYCAGILAKEIGVTKVSQMVGVGRRMPLTMTAFTIAALGMIGIPPTAGFISKWYLGTGAVEAGQGWVVPVLLFSSALNAAYFLPVITRAWFRAPVPAANADPTVPSAGLEGRTERDPWLMLPTLFTGGSVLLVGLLAASPLSPLSWATSISEAVIP